MFRNYVKIAVRNLLRHKGYSLINLSGLAMGIACCLLIAMYVQGLRQVHLGTGNGQRLPPGVLPATTDGHPPAFGIAKRVATQ